jgi:uncharacterized protein (TIGR02145 family)
MKSVVLIISIFFSFCSIAQKKEVLKDKRDGKVYPIVKIGDQTWLAENLNVATFRNGDPIPEAKTKEEWIEASKSGKPAWCYYENRAIQDDAHNGSKYGKLYNWYAVGDPRCLAPKGWHIPSDDEWTVLINSCGGLNKATRNKMVSVDSWTNTPSAKGINYFNLNILPGGFRRGINEEFNITYKSGEFGMLNSSAHFWSSTEFDKDKSHYRFFSYEIVRSTMFKWDGMSVRCVKD